MDYNDFICNHKEIQFIDSWLCNNSRKNNGLVIYGKTGTGKTYAIHKISELLDYELVEFNSTNIRSKNFFKEYVDKCSQYSSIYSNRHKIILIDEADIIFQADKSIFPEILRIMNQETTFNYPIICICDTTFSKKLRENITKKCDAVEFKGPSDTQINLYCKKITRKNGLRFSVERCFTLLSEIASGDIRVLVRSVNEIMEQVKRSKKKTITLSVINKYKKVHSRKDLFGSNLIELLERVLEEKENRSELFSLEPFMLPMTLHENYLECTEDFSKVERMTDLFSSMDVLSKDFIYSPQCQEIYYSIFSLSCSDLKPKTNMRNSSATSNYSTVYMKKKHLTNLLRKSGSMRCDLESFRGIANSVKRPVEEIVDTLIEYNYNISDFENIIKYTNYSKSKLIEKFKEIHLIEKFKEIHIEKFKEIQGELKKTYNAKIESIQDKPINIYKTLE